MEITMTSHGEMEILYGLEDTLRQVSRGALKSEVIEAVYGVMSRRFYRLMDAEMESGESEIRHMYEWEARKGNASHRLWFQDLLDDGVVVFYFRESTQQVPIDPRIPNVTSVDHVFRKKAEVFEKAERLSIRPVNVPYLRWYDDENRPRRYGQSMVKYKSKKDNTVISLGTDMDVAAGGRFENVFSNKFAIFWATAGEHGSAGLAQILGGSGRFRAAIKKSEHRKQVVEDLRKLSATQKRIISNKRNGPAAKRAAREMLAEIKKELKYYGATGR